MPASLIALGSNLGDRRGSLQTAVSAIAALRGTVIVARSSWHATTPIGGPEGQGEFLNGALLLQTTLVPQKLIAELREIERGMGRTRTQRWDARPIDLDILIYGDLVIDEPELQIPHPRMASRRFVLGSSADIAGWLRHPESGWTVRALANLHDQGENLVAVAAADADREQRLVGEIAAHMGRDRQHATADAMPAFTSRRAAAATDARSANSSRRPKLLLAEQPRGVSRLAARKMLQLPAHGPIAWIPADNPGMALADAAAAIESVWPGRSAAPLP